MTTYLTRTGHIELLDTWGHGRTPAGDWTARPATITVDDGDGHYAAWAYTGVLSDAAITLASLGRDFDDAVVWALNGPHLSPARRPDWAEGVEEVETDEDGEPVQYHYHPERHPGGVCMG